MYLCDVGGDFALPKLRSRSELSPGHILVTDPRTYRCLVLNGVEEDRLVAAGSPHLDATLRTPAARSVARRPRIAYLDVIWELDYANGRLGCGPYSKRRYLDEVRNAVADLDEGAS